MAGSRVAPALLAHFAPLQLNRLVAPAPIARSVDRRPLQLWLRQRSSMRPVDRRCRRVQLNLRLKHGRCARMLRTLRLGWTHRLGPINGRSRGPLYSSRPEDWRRTLYGGSARDALQERLHRIGRRGRSLGRPRNGAFTERVIVRSGLVMRLHRKPPTIPT